MCATEKQILANHCLQELGLYSSSLAESHDRLAPVSKEVKRPVFQCEPILVKPNPNRYVSDQYCVTPCFGASKTGSEVAAKVHFKKKSRSNPFFV